MRICFLAVFISFVAARPEGGAYRYSPPLLTVPGNGHLPAGPCCQQLALLKGGGNGGHPNGLLSGHSSNGFGHGLTSAVVTSGYAATGGGGYGGGVVGGHASGSAPAILAVPTPGGSVGGIGGGFAPSLGHGYANGGVGLGGGTGFGGAYAQGFGTTGGGFSHGGASIGHGGSSIGHGGSSIGHGGSFAHAGNGGSFGHGFNAGGFSSHGSGVGGGHGFSDFKPPPLINLPHNNNFSPSIGIDATGKFGGSSFPDQSGTSLVQKHIYVHVPPPDPEEELHTTKLASFVQPRKHYKIIFIKAPSAPTTSAAQIVANSALTEEKTLVYVLVKKPEEPSIEQIQAIQNNVHHSKPEVFFIKYKAKNHGHLAGAGHLGGAGFIGNGFAGGAGLAEAGGSFASGGGVALTSNVGSAHNIAHVSPSPTPYIPPPIIEPRIPPHHKEILTDTYGPPEIV